MIASASAVGAAAATVCTYAFRVPRSLCTTASLALRVSTAPFVRDRTAASAALRAATSAWKVASEGVGEGK